MWTARDSSPLSRPRLAEVRFSPQQASGTRRRRVSAVRRKPTLDPAQLLPVLRKLPATHNLDLATMPPEQKIGLIASVLVQLSGQSPESLADEARTALIEEATRIAEGL